MELLTPAEMDRADLLTISGGSSGFALMLHAGRHVAQAAIELAETGPILVIAGPGNNGGDGLIAATELVALGRTVHVMLLGERDALKGDAALAAREWKGPLLPFLPQSIGAPSLIIDALFGAGINRPVKDQALEMIEAVNASGSPVLSVDLPSGINGASGAVLGAAIKARETVTFFRRKPGHLLVPGRLYCGKLRVADIGIDPSVLAEIRPQAFENDPDLWLPHFPVPRTDGHKYGRGHAVVISGELSQAGAARLAARGALRAGAGLVTLASPREALAVNAGALTAVMVRAIDTPEELAEMLADRRFNAVGVGPGAGVDDRTRGNVLAAIAAGAGTVLDADALTAFAGAPETLFEAIKSGTNPQVVLTPHEGEFPRLFSDMSNKNPLRSKLERVRVASQRSGAIVLLKGPDTVVASPDGRAAIAFNAPPWLATAGAGDVLTGIITGLLAQRVPAFEAACIGVWMHGEAACEAGPGLIAEDLTETLPPVIRRVYDELGIEY